jgi:hypothetical protein
MVGRANLENDPDLMKEGLLLLEQCSLFTAQNAVIPDMHYYLGGGYHAVYRATKDSKHIKKALDHLALGILVDKSPQDRLDAARLWFGAAKEADHLSFTDWGFALDVIVDSITQLAGLEATVAKRHKFLRKLPWEVLVIVTALIADGELEKALQSLERVRGLVWSQLSSLRTPLDELRLHNPAIADRLEFLSRTLENAGGRLFPLEERLSGTEGRRLANQEEEAEHSQLAEEHQGLVRMVQTTYPGFEHFLEPPCLTNWSERLPQTGLVALIIVSAFRCDAIVLDPGSGKACQIPLSNFSLSKAQQLQHRLRSLLKETRLIERAGTELVDKVEGRGFRRIQKMDQSQILPSVLRDLWTLVVRPIFEALKLPVSQCFEKALIQ